MIAPAGSGDGSRVLESVSVTEMPSVPKSQCFRVAFWKSAWPRIGCQWTGGSRGAAQIGELLAVPMKTVAVIEGVIPSAGCSVVKGNTRHRRADVGCLDGAAEVVNVSEKLIGALRLVHQGNPFHVIARVAESICWK